MHLNELKALHVSEVLKQAEALEIENVGRMRKQRLMFAIIKKRAKTGETIVADGVLGYRRFGFTCAHLIQYFASTRRRLYQPEPDCFNYGDMIKRAKCVRPKTASVTLR